MITQEYLTCAPCRQPTGESPTSTDGSSLGSGVASGGSVAGLAAQRSGAGAQGDCPASVGQVDQCSRRRDQPGAGPRVRERRGCQGLSGSAGAHRTRDASVSPVGAQRHGAGRCGMSHLDGVGVRETGGNRGVARERPPLIGPVSEYPFRGGVESRSRSVGIRRARRTELCETNRCVVVEQFRVADGAWRHGLAHAGSGRCSRGRRAPSSSRGWPRWPPWRVACVPKPYRD